MKICAALLLLSFVVARGVRAEDVVAATSATPVPTAAEGDEKPEEAAKIDVATPTPEPGEEPADEHNVEPLDSWVVIPKKTPTPVPGEAESEPTPFVKHHPAVSDGDEDEEEEVLELENVETGAQLPESAANKAALDTAQRAHRVQLTKTQKQRIRRARIVRHRVMRETAKLIKLEPAVQGDTRGEAELRACTLNLNNYGTVDDYKRIFKAAQLPKREAIESATISAIAASKCDVVAFQSLLGTSESFAQLAVKQYLRKLTARVGGEWEGFLGTAARQVLRNGFFVRTDRMKVKRHSSFDAVRLTNFGQFSLTEFPRPPVLLSVEVPGKGEAKPKTIVFLTYDFRQSIVSAKPEPEALRMQVADGVRQIIHTEAQSFSPESPPIVVLLGDRLGPQPAPATQLLEGRLRLIDFTVDGGCALSPESKIECKTKPVHFKEFFGVSTEGYLLAPKVRTKKEEETEKKVLVYPSPRKERRARKAQREKTSEIYLQGADLLYAQANMFFPGRYRTGTMTVQTGLPQSPLVWAELNW